MARSWFAPVAMGLGFGIAVGVVLALRRSARNGAALAGAARDQARLRRQNGNGHAASMNPDDEMGD